MRPLVMSLAVAGLFSLTANLRAADDQPKDVIAKAIKAHGGTEHLTKFKAAQSKSKGTITISGTEIAFTQETSYVIPNKFKEAMELKVGGQTINVLSRVNDDKVSLEVNGKPMDVDDKIKTAMKDAGHLIKIGRLTPLLADKGYELSLVGEDKVEGKPAIGIRVVTKGYKDVNVYFNKETGLLAKMEVRTNDPITGVEVNEERIVTEYVKNKDGIPLPKKVVVKHDNKVFLDVEVLEINFFEKLDDSEFEK